MGKSYRLQAYMGDICSTVPRRKRTKAGYSAEGLLGAHKVCWELRFTDRQNVDEFVEHMERYGTERLGPTVNSSLDDVMEYMNDMQ